MMQLLLGLVLLACLPAPAAAQQRCRQPSITIDKDAGELLLRCGDTERLRLAVSFGGAPLGHKQRSGDQRTPEGRYAICTKHRSKRFYKFLGLDYPRPDDAARAVRRGLINAAQAQAIRQARAQGRCPPWGTALGGAIGIHGFAGGLNVAASIWTSLSRLGGLYRKLGFTDGCIGLTNSDVDKLWPLVQVGTPVVIYGPDHLRDEAAADKPPRGEAAANKPPRDEAAAEKPPRARDQGKR